MTLVLSIDPGMETGITLLDGVTLEKWQWQFEGGLEGFKSWRRETPELHEHVTVCEKFHPRQMARSYKMDELEPIRIEGYLEASRHEISWRAPEQRHLFNKGDEGFKKTAAFLKWAGLWAVGSDFGRPNANDANASMMHAIAELRDRKNRPTISLLLDYQRSIREEGTS